MVKTKTRTKSFRFSERVAELLEKLAEQDGLTLTAWIEATVIREARKRKIVADGGDNG